MRKTRRILDEAFKYAWGPAAVAALVVLGFAWAALYGRLVVAVGLPDMVNAMPDPVKLVLVGATALGIAVAASVRGCK